MNSNESFDIASKCEMLVFIEIITEYNSLSETVLAQRINLENINYKSVSKWSKETNVRIIDYFNQI